jgi:hypothetical protein
VDSKSNEEAPLAKAKQQRSPDDHLPKKHPRKSGKRGITATDVDPEDPNVKAGTIAAESATQQPLLESEEEAEEEESGIAEVKDDRVLMTFVKVALVRDRKTGDRTVNLYLSAGLSAESAALFSDAVRTRFEMMTNDSGLTDIGVDDLDMQVLEMWPTDSAQRVIKESVQPSKVHLAVVETKGSGQSVRIIRLSLVLPIRQRDPIVLWASQSHGDLFWVALRDQQARLG